MALHYGFYNSSGGDRKYSAEDFTKLFDGIIKDGIFMSIGQHFAVTASSGLSVSVGSGRAWFDHTYTYNDNAIILTHNSNNTLLDRIDAVVLEVNHEAGVRANSIKILTGPTTATTRPTPVKSATVNQYVLAYVRVNSGATQLTQGNITNMVGTTDAPFVTGLMETIDATTLLNQWNSQFDTFMTTSNGRFNTSMDAWNTEFHTWYDNLQPLFEEEDYQEILLRVQAVANVRSATFTANGWQTVSGNNGVYSQTVTVEGMSSDYNPILVSLLPPSATAAQASTYNRAFAWMSSGRGETGTNSVTMYCYGGKPEATITVGLKGE